MELEQIEISESESYSESSSEDLGPVELEISRGNNEEEEMKAETPAVPVAPRHGAPPLFQHQDVFARNILTFLSASDLCRLAQCSRFCHQISLQKHLWVDLLRVDFNPDADSLLGPDCSYRHEAVCGGFIPVERNKYKHIHEIVCGRIKRAQDLRSQLRSEELAERSIDAAQKCLDLTQFRLLVVLPGVAVVVTLILFGIKYDGATFSTWFCLSPLFFLVLYVLVSALVSCTIFHNRRILSSPLRTLWPKMQSPINYLYENVLKGKKVKQGFVITIYVLAAAQLVFLGIKLTGDIPAMDGAAFDWGLVFLPLWVLFTMYLIAPFIWRQINGGYIATLFLLWLPLLILFICVAIKLNNSADDAAKLSLDLILIPFWIIEGMFMLGGLIYAIVQYRRYRLGALERMDEPIGACASVWCGMTPFVLTQALLSVRDHGDGNKSGITVMGALSPLVVVAVVVTLSSCIGVWRENTSFETRRAERQNETAGTAVIFDI